MNASRKGFINNRAPGLAVKAVQAYLNSRCVKAEPSDDDDDEAKTVAVASNVHLNQRLLDDMIRTTKDRKFYKRLDPAQDIQAETVWRCCLKQFPISDTVVGHLLVSFFWVRFQTPLFWAFAVKKRGFTPNHSAPSECCRNSKAGGWVGGKKQQGRIRKASTRNGNGY